jgi:multisubunit Na+/H+ antiporter MnhB subunit
VYPGIDPPEDRMGGVQWTLAIAALAAFVVLGYAVSVLPVEARGLAAAATARLSETGLGNAVNAVLLSFRAFDTLLEKAVLVLALVGIWGLVSETALERPAGNLRTRRPVEPQLTLLLKALVPLALLAAIYLFWIGADEAGGAFQSGTILAAICILLVLSRALPMPSHASLPLRWSVVAGFLVFSGVGITTGVVGTGFLDYPEGWSKPIILLIEAGLAVSVAATLFLQANGLPDDHGGGAGR